MSEGLHGDIEQYLSTPEQGGSDQEKLDKYSSDAQNIIHESPEWSEYTDEEANVRRFNILKDEGLTEQSDFELRHTHALLKQCESFTARLTPREDPSRYKTRWTDEIEERIQDKKPVFVLDIGGVTGKWGRSIKKRFGDGVNMTVTTIEGKIPHQKVDSTCILAAEWFPKDFESHFDLIVSSVALRYSHFPHLAIENICRALKPGGKAEFDLPDFYHNEEFRNRDFVEYYENKSGIHMNYDLRDTVAIGSKTFSWVNVVARVVIKNKLEELSSQGYKISIIGTRGERKAIPISELITEENVEQYLYFVIAKEQP